MIPDKAGRVVSDLDVQTMSGGLRMDQTPPWLQPRIQENLEECGLSLDGVLWIREWSKSDWGWSARIWYQGLPEDPVKEYRLGGEE